MRIAYVIGVFPLASETFVYREVLGLRNQGLEIDIYSVIRPSPEQVGRLPDAALDLMREVCYLDAPALVKGLRVATKLGRAIRLNRRFDQEATRKAHSIARLARACAIAAELKRRPVDRLHAHWPYGTQIAALVHALTNLPFSASIHAHEVEHEAGHFPTVFDRLDTAFFCNGAAMERLLSQLPDSARRKAHLNYHGVDLNLFPRLPLPPRAHRLQILSSGRLTATKGFDRLIRGIARARERGISAHLTILGDGAERVQLERLVASLRLEGCVHLAGWVPHDRVRDYLGRADVFAILPDVNYHDGLPNVVIEAMAAGRPVILSPLPAAREAVRTGQEGFILAAPDAVDEFADRLGELAERPALRASMGALARSAVGRKFDAARQLTLMRSRLCGLDEPRRGELDDEGRIRAGRT